MHVALHKNHTGLTYQAQDNAVLHQIYDNLVFAITCIKSCYISAAFTVTGYVRGIICKLTNDRRVIALPFCKWHNGNSRSFPHGQTSGHQNIECTNTCQGTGTASRQRYGNSTDHIQNTSSDSVENYFQQLKPHENCNH